MTDEPDAEDVPEQDELERKPVPVADNAADPKAIRRRRLRKEVQEQDIAKFWRGVLGDPIGRQEIWRHLQDAHAFEERFACGPNGFPQPEATWFHAGEQAFGQRFYQKLLGLDPLAVRQMHAEHDPRFSQFRSEDE